MGLVYYHVRKWKLSAKNCGIELEDLVMAGIEGLRYGILTFQPTKGKSFSSYITRPIKSYIKCEFKKLSRHSDRTVSLSKALYKNDNGDEITLGEILPGEDGMRKAEDRILARDILRFVSSGRFTEFEILIFQMKYACGRYEGEKPMSLNEIKAKLNLGISAEAIRKKIKKISNAVKAFVNGRSV